MPRKKETLADLTDNMRTALLHCTSRGVLPTEFGDRWPTVTQRALVDHGLIHLVRNRKGRELWRPTDVGRGLVATHIPSLMVPAGRPGRDLDGQGPRGYTNRPHESMWGEPEAA